MPGRIDSGRNGIHVLWQEVHPRDDNQVFFECNDRPFRLPADTLTNPPEGNVVKSSRYFNVRLPGGSVEVSDVLYTDDADAGWSLIYMNDPSDKSIWAAIIEKAMAVSLKGYETSMLST